MDKRLHILILEDVATDAELVERELRKAHIKFSAKRVETKEGFIFELKNFNPDLTLADYSLPAFDGITALSIAQDRCPDMPFVSCPAQLATNWPSKPSRKAPPITCLKTD